MTLNQKIKDAIAKKGSQLLKKVETFAVAEAKRQTPVLTGSLKESIRIEEETDTSFVLRWGSVGVLGTQIDVNYQKFVARGTRYQKANPYDVRTKIAIGNKFKNATVK